MPLNKDALKALLKTEMSSVMNYERSAPLLQWSNEKEWCFLKP